MLNIKSILMFLYEEVKSQSPRVIVLDDEHVLDTKTGVELHMYDDQFKVTHNEDTVAVHNYFTKQEQEIVWAIKQLITDPIKAAKRLEEYPIILATSRERLSDLFENPEPVVDTGPVEEDNTVAYTG